jgi:hypothetical protein
MEMRKIERSNRGPVEESQCDAWQSTSVSSIAPFLAAFGLPYGITALFVRRPNQDDVVSLHRVLTQLLDINQPIYPRQTSVDMDAATFSPVHLATNYEMLMGFVGHYLRLNPL